MRISAEFFPDILICGISIISKRCLVHGALEVLVTSPVTVGFLDHNVSLGQQPLQHFADVKFFRILRHVRPAQCSRNRRTAP